MVEREVIKHHGREKEVPERAECEKEGSRAEFSPGTERVIEEYRVEGMVEGIGLLILTYIFY